MKRHKNIFSNNRNLCSVKKVKDEKVLIAQTDEPFHRAPQKLKHLSRTELKEIG